MKNTLTQEELFFKTFKTIQRSTKLDPYEKDVITYIQSFKTCFASNQTIATELGMSKRKAIYCITKLIDLGIVSKSIYKNEYKVDRHTLNINQTVLAKFINSEEELFLDIDLIEKAPEAVIEVPIIEEKPEVIETPEPSLMDDLKALEKETIIQPNNDTLEDYMIKLKKSNISPTMLSDIQIEINNGIIKNKEEIESILEMFQIKIY